MNTLIDPSTPTFTIAIFGTVDPADGFKLDAFGMASPVGHAVRNVPTVAPVAVTFTATAPTPDAGTPPRPTTGTTTVPPGPAAPTGGPSPSTVPNPRVSAKRAGTTALYPKPAGSCVEVGSGVGVALGLGVGVALGLGVGVALGLGLGVGVGVALGLGVGVALGLGVGVGGVATGVANTTADDAPGPTSFTARKATRYCTVLVNPVMTSGDAQDAGERVRQVAPASREYS